MSRMYPRCDQRVLGWLTAGMLSLMLSSTAWGLDLDHEISKAEGASAQILGTLGRGKTVNAATTADTDAKVQIQLRPKSKTGKRG